MTLQPVLRDTPINRLCIKDMTVEQLEALVNTFQERRMGAYTIYMQAQDLKAEVKHTKDAEQLERRCEQLQKLLVTVDNGLDKMRKYLVEIQVLRLALED